MPPPPPLSVGSPISSPAPSLSLVVLDEYAFDAMPWSFPNTKDGGNLTCSKGTLTLFNLKALLMYFSHTSSVAEAATLQLLCEDWGLLESDLKSLWLEVLCSPSAAKMLQADSCIKGPSRPLILACLPQGPVKWHIYLDWLGSWHPWRADRHCNSFWSKPLKFAETHLLQRHSFSRQTPCSCICSESAFLQERP